MSLSPIEINVLLGLALGTLMGLTGAGGGILAIPLLMYFDGLGLRQASPIGLFATFAASACGAMIGLVQGKVRYKAAIWIGNFGILFAPFGVWIAHQVSVVPLTLLFISLLLLIGWRMFHKNTVDDCKTVCQKKENGKLQWTAICARILAATGAVAGAVSGLLGVGGGFMIIPALARYTNLDMLSIQATALAITALVALSGTLTNLAHHAINWSITWPFTLAAVVAMLVSRQFANRLPQKYLRYLFGLLCFGVAGIMLYKLAQQPS